MKATNEAMSASDATRILSKLVCLGFLPFLLSIIVQLKKRMILDRFIDLILRWNMKMDVIAQTKTGFWRLKFKVTESILSRVHFRFQASAKTGKKERKRKEKETMNDYGLWIIGRHLKDLL